MSIEGPDQLLHAVLPPALEVLTAWSLADTEADPSIFRQALNRVFGDAADAPDPQRGLVQMMFGLSSLSGILLDELAQATGRSHGEVLHGVHLRYLNSGPPAPR
jgi:hypothetical protein